MVPPSAGLPLIAGGVVFTGGAAATVALPALAELIEPSGLVAVMTERTLAPSSATPSVYVEPVALPLDLARVPAAGPRPERGREGLGALRGPG